METMYIWIYILYNSTVRTKIKRPQICDKKKKRKCKSFVIYVENDFFFFFFFFFARFAVVFVALCDSCNVDGDFFSLDNKQGQIEPLCYQVSDQCGKQNNASFFFSGHNVWRENETHTHTYLTYITRTPLPHPVFSTLGFY